MKQYILGIDTGGTYTDGVVLDAETKVVYAKHKSRTTDMDLSVGIRECIKALQIDDYSAVKLVCISTTLATNAVVEGNGGQVALLTLGCEVQQPLPCAWQRALRGKLNIKGIEVDMLDPKEIEAVAQEIAAGDFDAVAVSGFASVRNPAHELFIREVVREKTELPVVCAHELSSSLGYYERTVTAALNAGLIVFIEELCSAIRKVLEEFGITANVMINKGDGSLMEMAEAQRRPIETILSGPAASITGGLFLSGKQDGQLVDMGGTTTDIAHAHGGKIEISASGACVGGWKTQVRAADIYTVGLGGDSYIRIEDGAAVIGPKRVVPLCVAVDRYPHLLDELQAIPEVSAARALDCIRLKRQPQRRAQWTELEQRLVELVRETPHSIAYLCQQLFCTDEEIRTSAPLNQNVLQLISVTPTDVLHGLGRFTPWNQTVSKLVLSRMAKDLAMPEAVLEQHLYDRIVDRMDEVCRSAAEQAKAADGLAVIGIGAPAATWIGALAQKGHQEVLVPEHAEVANAVGVAVAQVMESAVALIRPDQEHKGFLLHLPQERKWFESVEEAADYGTTALRAHIKEKMSRAGSDQYAENLERVDLRAEDSEQTYIQTQITCSGTGVPRWVLN